MGLVYWVKRISFGGLKGSLLAFPKMDGREKVALFWNRPEAAHRDVRFVFSLCLFFDGQDWAVRGVLRPRK